jgi:hypothetical protein
MDAEHTPPSAEVGEADQCNCAPRKEEATMNGEQLPLPVAMRTMPPALEKFEFTEEDWDEVQAFDCGDKPYQLEVSNWLKCPIGQDGALTTIKRDPPGKVWLYRLPAPDGRIVGFGAMDKAREGWRWKGAKDPKIPVTLILWYGVQTPFKKQPPSANPDDHYSSAILDDLIACAYDDQETYPVLGLCVQQDNTVAIDLYKRKQFTEELSTFTDRETGVVYARMARILNPGHLIAILDEQKAKKKK